MQSEDYKDNALKLAGCLRKADIPADVYLRNVKFKKKMEYANKIQIPYLIIIGEDEAAAGDYTLKNMATGEQKRLSLEQVAAEIKADAWDFSQRGWEAPFFVAYFNYPLVFVMPRVLLFPKRFAKV